MSITLVIRVEGPNIVPPIPGLVDDLEQVFAGQVTVVGARADYVPVEKNAGPVKDPLRIDKTPKRRGGAATG